MSGERSSHTQLSRERKGLIWFILFLYPSGSRVAVVMLHYGHSRFIIWIFHIRPYLSGCLTEFNFEELNYAFHLTMKSYIYIYIYILYIEKERYTIICYIRYTGASLDIFLSESTMCTSLPLRRLRWSTGTAGRSSPNRVPAPHSRNVTSRTPQNFGVRVALPGRRRICWLSFSLDSLQLERPDANGPGLLRAAPLGKSGVHCITRCPSLLSALSANPASVPECSGLQRALLSVSSTQNFSRAGRLATPSGVSRAARSAVSCRSPASGHRASHSKYTKGQFWETGSLSRLFGSMETTALDRSCTL